MSDRYAPEYLDEGDRELVGQLTNLLEAAESETGLGLVETRLAEESPQAEKARAELNYLLGGFLIDFGDDLGRPDAIEKGIAIFEAEREEIGRLVGSYSVEYCLGNARYSLYKHRVRSTSVPFRPVNLKLLTEAKNHYWRTIQLLGSAGDSGPQIYVNLGNALDTSGRVIEAIRQYDRALEIDPSFGMAHVNRGMALGTLNEMSDTYSLNMLQQQQRHFAVAADDERLAKNSRDYARKEAERCTAILEEHGVDETEEEHQEHVKAEIEAASPFRRFCIGAKLILNEHALYCRCAGAQRDSLSIPKATGPIGGAFVPAMELLLNRVRAEFALARMLYYRFDRDPLDTEDYEPEYAELFDNEQLGMSSELLRTSFRLCFGILDRIAFGACRLFELAPLSENIYFESFWRKPSSKPAAEERWQRINAIDNWGLTALYSQATDLSIRGGEWHFYKEWRNRLEHEVLILTDSGHLNLGPWIKGEASDWLKAVDLGTFRKETLHLLQIAAAAIFYFTFCARREGIKALDDQKRGMTITIDKRSRADS